ncbi:diacylglycerol kinase catalytic domain-containing protein [Xylariomycetidae sp. FL0641]|nr:diacylglycerol kinase catalytic domain-containing protein [Xylariomycetidae sp. FL0641]
MGSTTETGLDDILVLDHGVSLALVATDLVVKDKVQARNHQTTICGFPIGGAPSDFKIPLYNILWAAIVENALLLDYATPYGKGFTPAQLRYPIPTDLPAHAVEAWIESLLAQSYGKAQRRKRAKVLVNPHAGPGGADKKWEKEVKPLFEAAHMELDVVTTKFSGEAIGIVESLNLDAYDVIIPCSGDGLPYEVFNGLGKRKDAKKALRQMAVAHIPCGSGNAMSCNLNGTHRPSPAALAIIKGVRTAVDLMSITQGQEVRRTLSFLSQSVGIIAECDLGTEHMRWLGPARFNVGIAQRIFSKKIYPCDVALKVEIQDKDKVKAHYKRDRAVDPFGDRKEGGAAAQESLLSGETLTNEAETGEGLPPLRFGTVNDEVPADWEQSSLDKMGSFYCGNMAWMAPDANFFTAACPNDGLMDLVINDGDISATKYVELMLSVETGRFFDNPLVSYRKLVAYRFTPRNQEDGYISIDGERVPFEPFQVEVHQGLGTVLSKTGRYEAAGPTGWEKA